MGIVIPEGLQRALEAGRVERTDAGAGPITVRRLADLVLPTGRVLVGYPGSPRVNEPSPVRPSVAPGRYQVFASLVDLPRGCRELAFVVVRFDEGPPVSWEEAGAFFTDSGLGCLMDESCVPLLERRREAGADLWGLLHEVRDGVFGDGDCNLVLEEASGANAIVFATHDSRYPCFLGTGQGARPVWLVVDCR